MIKEQNISSALTSCRRPFGALKEAIYLFPDDPLYLLSRSRANLHKVNCFFIIIINISQHKIQEGFCAYWLTGAQEPLPKNRREVRK